MPVCDLSDTIALVLASGRGKRMGGPKALMRIGHGKPPRSAPPRLAKIGDETLESCPWWYIQHARIRGAGVEPLWVASVDVVQGIINDAAGLVAAGPIRCVSGVQNRPMFASLLEGLKAIRKTPPRAVFILPVDVPAPVPAVWRALVATESDVAAPAHRGKGGHPVLLSWEWAQREILAHKWDTRTARLDLLIRPVVERIEVDDPAVVADLNTPADVEAWLAHEEGREGSD